MANSFCFRWREFITLRGAASAARLLSARVQQANRSMQARAALAHGVSQQAFKHGTGILIADVIAVRVTPIGKIPLGGASFGD